MRRVPASLEAKLRSARQTSANNSAPSLDLWISRPVVPLVNDYFLEQQAVQDGSNVTAVDIAVCHPRHRRQSTKIYMARVEGGTARVLSSPFRHAMEAHVWTDSGFSEPAEDVSIAFDAAMKNDTRGRSEFVTEDLPWVFWVRDGALYGRKLGSANTLTLAEANCTKCTAIRAAGSAMGGFDYGLCLFFLLSGAIYVRQLIGGEWMDAEPIGFGPDVTWTDIAASRSWDYRVVLQALSGDGTVYELYTQYMGIGQRSAEHIEVKRVSAEGELTGIRYADTAETEHIEIAAIDAGALYGGLYSTLQPVFMVRNVPVDAMDIDGNHYQDWGKVILATSSVHLDVSTVGAEPDRFVLTDSSGKTFVAAAVELDTADGMTLRLSFADFNAAKGSCTLAYTPGNLVSLAGTVVGAVSAEFVPENLVAPSVAEPKPVDAYVMKPDGTQIAVVFSEEITDGITADGWTVTMPEYDMVPGGTLSSVSRTVTAAAAAGDAKVVLLSFAAGNQTSVQNAAGPITVAYNGATLAGLSGFVQAFELECPIDGLAYKGGQNDVEHIEISGVTATGALKKIEYKNVKADEHIGISAITATGTLTHVDDI